MVDSVEVSASVTVDRQPVDPSYVQVTLTGGTTGSGTVTVSGTDSAGAAASEDLTYAANGVKATTTRFASVSTITTTGLADEATPPTILVEAVSGDGTPNLISHTVASSRPVMFSASGRADFPALVQGTHEMDGAKVLLDFEEVWTPRVDDLATDDQLGDTWVVLGVRPILLGYGYRPHHYEVRVNRYNT